MARSGNTVRLGDVGPMSSSRTYDRPRAAGFRSALLPGPQSQSFETPHHLAVSTRIRNVPRFPAIGMTLRRHQNFPVRSRSGRFHDYPVNPRIDDLFILRRVQDRVGSMGGYLEDPVLIMDGHPAAHEVMQRDLR